MKINELSRIPALAYRRFGRWLFLPFILATIASAYSLSRLVVSGDVSQEMPARDPYVRDARLDAEHFLPNDFTIVSVGIVDGDSAAALSRVASLSDELRRLQGVGQVVSAATVADLRVSADEIGFQKLFRAGSSEQETRALVSTLQGTPIFQEFLISRDASAFSIYVFADSRTSSKSLVPRIESICAQGAEREVRVLGKGSFASYVERTLVPDLVLLGSIAMAIILVFEIALTRSLLVGAILWVTTLLPSVWTLGLFPPLGLRLSTQTICIPLIILALSTTYGIHLFRYLALGRNPAVGTALSDISPVILAAGFTTILGFLSLLGSPLREIRVMGAMLMVGIALAVASSLFLLPVLFASVRIPRLPGLRGASSIARLSLSRLVPYAFAAAMLALLVGVAFIHNEYRPERYLSRRTALARTIEYFSDRYGGVNELELIVDTGRENGLVDPSVFEGMRGLQRDLAGFRSVSHVVSYTQFVEWVHGRLAGNGDPAAPSSESAIGESLELLSYGTSGWGMGFLVDRPYRRAKLVVRFGEYRSSPAEAARALSSLIAGIGQSVRQRLPDAQYAILGEPVVSLRRLAYMIRGQLSGVAIYFFLLYFYAALYFRSWRWPLIAMLPSACGVVVYLGVMGWVQVPLSSVTTMSIAAVMGVGVDDVLCLITFYRARRAHSATEQALEETMQMSGSAIIQTTLIIVLALLALLFSRYAAFVQTSLLAGFTFLCCTAVTIVVVPGCIRRLRGTGS